MIACLYLGIARARMHSNLKNGASYGNTFDQKDPSHEIREKRETHEARENCKNREKAICARHPLNA